MHILVAEDDLTTREMVVTLLRSWEYKVSEAGNGIKAWATLQSPDSTALCLLDRQMPGLDGIALCRRIRTTEATRHCYVLFVTVSGSRQDIVDGFAAGADDYATKPFDRNELRVRVGVGKRVVELQTALRVLQSKG